MTSAIGKYILLSASSENVFPDNFKISLDSFRSVSILIVCLDVLSATVFVLLMIFPIRMIVVLPVRGVLMILKQLIRFKDSETVKVVVKIIFFVLKLIFKKNCDGENKKG